VRLLKALSFFSSVPSLFPYILGLLNPHKGWGHPYLKRFSTSPLAYKSLKIFQYNKGYGKF